MPQEVHAIPCLRIETWDSATHSPVPNCEGPGAPSAGFDIVIETGTTCRKPRILRKLIDGALATFGYRSAANERFGDFAVAQGCFFRVILRLMAVRLRIRKTGINQRLAQRFSSTTARHSWVK
jgi:hypothetical protein